MANVSTFKIYFRKRHIAFKAPSHLNTLIPSFEPFSETALKVLLHLQLCCRGCLDALTRFKMFIFCGHGNCRGDKWHRSCTVWDLVNKVDEVTLKCFYEAALLLDGAWNQHSLYFWSQLIQTLMKDGSQNGFSKWREQWDTYVSRKGYFFWEASIAIAFHCNKFKTFEI